MSTHRRPFFPTKRIEWTCIRLTLRVLLIGSVFAGCDTKTTPPPPSSAQVTALKTEMHEARLTLQVPAQTAGGRTIELRARIEGTFQKQCFQEGSVVQEGELLIQIDPRPFDVEREKAQAALLEATSNRKTADAHRRRSEKLRKKGFVSGQDLDNTQNAYVAATAREKSAHAHLEKTKLDLSYTRILAPFTGVASSLSQYEGSLISPRVVLTTISALDPLHVKFGLSELLWLEFQKHLNTLDQIEARLLLADGSVYPEKGKVIFIDSRVDPQTGVLEMWAAFPNPQLHLKAGLFVQIKLTYGDPEPTIFIPQRAVFQEPRGPFVFIMNAANQAEKRSIQGFPWNGSTFRVTQGLNPGETIVVDGALTVREKMPLHVTAWEPQPPLSND